MLLIKFWKELLGRKEMISTPQLFEKKQNQEKLVKTRTVLTSPMKSLNHHGQMNLLIDQSSSLLGEVVTAKL